MMLKKDQVGDKGLETILKMGDKNVLSKRHVCNTKWAMMGLRERKNKRAFGFMLGCVLPDEVVGGGGDDDGRYPRIHRIRRDKWTHGLSFCLLVRICKRRRKGSSLLSFTKISTTSTAHIHFSFHWPTRAMNTD
jgi:hypothetical protein